MTRSLFLSYAHIDKPTRAFLNLLNEYLATAHQVDFRLWRDTHILPGKFWDAEIREALAACDAGILLVSPAFLGRDYIRGIELPALLSKAIPVALEAIRFDGTMNLQGLERHQIFHDTKGRAFGQLTSRQDRRKFVDELFGQIMALTLAAQ